MQFPSRINLILNDRKLQAKANIEVPAKVWLLEDYSREDLGPDRLWQLCSLLMNFIQDFA